MLKLIFIHLLFISTSFAQVHSGPTGDVDPRKILGIGPLGGDYVQMAMDFMTFKGEQCGLKFEKKDMKSWASNFRAINTKLSLEKLDRGQQGVLNPSCAGEKPQSCTSIFEATSPSTIEQFDKVLLALSEELGPEQALYKELREELLHHQKLLGKE